MPSSLLVGALVLAWLVVLVPMIARKRQEVARTADTALAARVVARGPAPAVEEHHVTQSENGVVDDEEESTTELPLPETDLAGQDDEPGLAEEEPETDSGPWVTEPEPDETVQEVEVGTRFEVGTSFEVGAAPEAEPAPEFESAPEAEAEPQFEVETDPAAEADEGDESAYLTRPYRPGRGGYNAEAAELEAAAKYGLRRKIVLGLLLGLGVAFILALAIAPVIFWAFGLLAVGFAGYLTYLRRQVRIEADIRSRRAARQRFAESEEHEQDAEAEEGGEAEPQHPKAPRLTVHPGTTVVDHDDDDPAFAELDDPDVLPYRHASGQ